MTFVEIVDRLCVLSGIEPFYFDIFGNRHETTLESKILVLSALGSNVSSLAVATESLNTLQDASWRKRLPPFIVERLVPDGFDVELFLPSESAYRSWGWNIKFENGEQGEGSFHPQDLPLLENREIDGHRVERRRLRIHSQALIGYHQLQIMDSDVSDATLALTPERCYLPEIVASQDRRLWGLSGHLYTIRSEHNWGIGDFGDLARLCTMAGRAGASALAINPLHALFPDKPDEASPYSPSSRLFLNPIYVDVDAAPFAPSTLDPQSIISSSRIHTSTMVEYPKVWAAKRRAFELLFQAAEKGSPNDHQALDFRHFVQKGGRALQQFAVFSTLEEVYGDGGNTPWQQWPVAYQVPESSGLERFKIEQARRIGFHQYIQYLANNQLANAALQARTSGMEIGIIRDLALGASPDGCDAWRSGESFAKELRCGAPPDEFNPHGQEWGVLPLDPLHLRQDYEPFRAMLQANMRHAGGLRIDHIIGLQRQFLVPLGGAGCYVRFPIDEMVNIVALESHRNACLVIGEDLGTVPEGFRNRMQEANILGCSLLYFERSHDGAFTVPHNYRKKAAASVATHDLPTFGGYWEGRDIAIKQNLGISTPVEANELRERRRLDTVLLINAFVAGGFLDTFADENRVPDVPVLRNAVHAFLASSSASLFLAQIDDLTGEKDQVNLPGTTNEYPNWRRKLSVSLDEPSFVDLVNELAEICRAQARGR